MKTPIDKKIRQVKNILKKNISPSKKQRYEQKLSYLESINKIKE